MQKLKNNEARPKFNGSNKKKKRIVWFIRRTFSENYYQTPSQYKPVQRGRLKSVGGLIIGRNLTAQIWGLHYILIGVS